MSECFQQPGTKLKAVQHWLRLLQNFMLLHSSSCFCLNIFTHYSGWFSRWWDHDDDDEGLRMIGIRWYSNASQQHRRIASSRVCVNLGGWITRNTNCQETIHPAETYSSCASLGCCKLFLKFLDFLCRLGLSFPRFRAYKMTEYMASTETRRWHVVQPGITASYWWLPVATICYSTA